MMFAGLLRAAVGAVLSIVALSAFAAEYPAPREGTYVAKDFRFTPARFCRR
jgi:homoserine O-acetyltransferase/O-succinyltransferase